MTEMAETHVELNQFPVPRVGPRHSTHVQHRSRLISLFCIGLVEARLDVLVMNVQQQRAFGRI